MRRDRSWPTALSGERCRALRRWVAAAARGRQYRVVNRVLFAAGFVAFSLLYVTQGMLPEFSADFGVSPARASLSVSLTSLALALGVVLAASVSERHGRRAMLVLSVAVASVCGLLTALSPSFRVLLALRLLTGLSLAGLPAAAMAYLAEEVEPRSLGAAIGFYISGTGIGGLAGRLLGGCWPGWSAGASGWRPWPLPGCSAACTSPATYRREGALRRLFVCGFVLIGAQVAFFNYLVYRLRAAPFGLS